MGVGVAKRKFQIYYFCRPQKPSLPLTRAYFHTPNKCSIDAFDFYFHDFLKEFCEKPHQIQLRHFQNVLKANSFILCRSPQFAQRKTRAVCNCNSPWNYNFYFEKQGESNQWIQIKSLEFQVSRCLEKVKYFPSMAVGFPEIPGEDIVSFEEKKWQSNCHFEGSTWQMCRV